MNPQPDIPRSLLILQGLVFLDMMGVGMVIPILPELARSFHATPAMFGMMGTFYGIGQLIGAPLTGYLSDRFGRKGVLLFSFLDCAVSYALLAVVQSFEMLLLCRVMVGLGKQTMSISQAYVSDLTNHHERTASIARLSSTIGIGFIFGPLIGSMLSRINLRLPLVVSSSLFALDVVVGYWMLPDTRLHHREQPSPANPKDPSESTAASRLKEMWSLLTSLVGGVLLMRFFYAAMHILFQETLLLFVSVRYGFDSTSTGPILSYLGLLSVFVQGILIPFLHHYFEDNAVLILSSSVMGLSALTIALLDNVYLFLFALSVNAIGAEVLKTSLTSMYSKVVPPQQRGTYLGVNSSLDAVVRIFMPTLSGLLFQLDPSGPYLFSGTLLMAFSGILLYSPVKIPTPSDPGSALSATTPPDGSEIDESKKQN